VNILVLSKSKTDYATQFIDVSSENFFKKETNNNVLTDKHIEQIMQMFADKKDVEYISKTVRNEVIAENDYNLSVSNYVEAEDTREKVDIDVLNTEISKSVEKINQLRSDIDDIVAEIENNTSKK